MAVTAVVFDVGETLVDEAATYARWQDAGVELGAFTARDLHEDVPDCLRRLRERGLRLGAAGNMRSVHEAFLRDLVDFVGSSETWGVRKPDPGFFERIVRAAAAPPAEIAYVGDRVDNDVLPALAAGMTAVHVRRGAHADVEPPPDVRSIRSLEDLPEVLGV